MATKVTPQRRDFYVEELDYKSSLSENLFTKVGEATQFINDKQLLHHEFKYLGRFVGIAGGGEDGVLAVPFNYDLAGLAVHLKETGTSLITTIDIHHISANGTDNGTILSTKINIDYSEPNGSTFFVNLLDSSSSAPASSNSSLPVFSSTTFNAGDTMRVDIDANASNAENLSIHLYYRPR